MKPINFLISFLLLVSSCKQGNTNSLSYIKTNEETLLHPKFDSQRLYGLGIFKIGILVDSSVGLLISAKKYGIDSVYDTSLEDIQSLRKTPGEKYIYRVIPSIEFDTITMKMRAYNASLWCKGTIAYIIRGYDIDSLEINDLTVKYYNNRLVYVECKTSTELNTAIALKYGKTTASNDWYDYKNGDLEAGYSSSVFKVYVKGARAFLEDCGEKDFVARDSAKPGKNIRSLKNL